ncbi:MAG: DUF4198 domain-containing protein [Deltaproteobacteria bacterium]|nr:DUF4198 domain-containing protein [Deltaproteobacteria bacterium]
MKKTAFIILAALFAAAPAWAHFGMVIPTDSMVMPEDDRALVLTLSFSHPMEMVGMPMEKPVAFTVTVNGKTTDLTPSLAEIRVMGQPAWKASFPVRRPGVYAFAMEPAPYWEPAEDCYIVHLTKTVVAAFGDEDGWDAELGLKTEIVPLTRPFGLYAGNTFQGVVKMDGEPAPYSVVEVEYYNRDKTHAPPNDYMVTQSVRADANGVFTYTAPWAGWWGFAALNEADETIIRDGEQKPVELGAVLWVEFVAGK